MRKPNAVVATDTVVMFPETAVMFVAGEAGRPIAEQAPKAFGALEARLPSLKGRRFFGVVAGRGISGLRGH
jgi:hypothetical protein